MKNSVKAAGAFVMAAFAPLAVISASPDYTGLNGLKGASLKAAVKEIALPHKEISYGDATWEAFSVADVRDIYDMTFLPGNNPRKAWFDMYSNRLVWVESGHSGMNIEHAVANSWWGGVRNAAYKDLHHLNPSDADANNRKNNLPLGVIEGQPTWSNGLTNIGRPVYGNGGGSAGVFEPADEYKGDFARAYFYIFTIYDDIAWQTDPACMYDLSAYPTLQPWAYEMLLDWASKDPVDEREAGRNSAVAGIQENENPFVSIPGLADYIWGEKKDKPFDLEDAKSAPIRNRPMPPNFSWAGDFMLAGVNTWTGRWWEPLSLNIMVSESEEGYYSISDSLNPNAEEEWQPLYDGIEIPAAKKAGQIITIRTRSRWWDEPDRYSSISTLTLTAVEEGTTNYMNAKWAKVTESGDINTESQYIIVAPEANAVMASESGSTSSSAFIKVAGSIDPDADGYINRVPEGTAVIELEQAGGNQYYIQVNDLALNPQGYLISPAAKKAQIAEEGMNAVISLTPEKNTKIDFGAEYGTLQYNAQSPRFSVYTSNQKPVVLYRCVAQESSVAAPEISPAELPTRIFTFDGIEVLLPESQLPAGFYIIVKEGKARKVHKN